MAKLNSHKTPPDVCDGTPVIVTFLPFHSVDLQERGIDQARAAALRAQLAAFAEDWESPEMNAYDNYDEAKSQTINAVM